MRTKEIRLIVKIMIICFINCCQILASLPNPYIINFSRTEYDASSKNWSIAEDEKGIMYFANNAGLLESDGLKWNKYIIPSYPLVRSVAAKNHNRIYTGGNGTFGVWERNQSGKLVYKSLSNLLKSPMETYESIWRIHLNDSLIYFQSFSNIYIYDGHSLEKINKKNGFLFLEKVHEDYIVQNIDGLLYKLTDRKLTAIKGSEIFHQKTVRVILPAADSSFLAGTSEGEIYIYQNKKFTLLNPTLNNTLKGLELNCGTYSKKRRTYFLGTQLKGIFEIDTKGNVINNYCSNNSLQNNTVLSLYEDNKQNIWAALDKGLSYVMLFNDLSFFSFDPKSSKTVYDVKMWNKTFYFATNQGVFSIPLDEFYSTYYDTSKIKMVKGTQGQSWALKLIDNKLLCCHNSGIIEIQNSGQGKYILDVDEGVFTLSDFYFNRKHLLMVIGYKNLRIIDLDTGKNNIINNLPLQIYKGCIDEVGDIWLETYNKGIFRCKLNDTYDAFQYINYYGTEEEEGINSCNTPKIQICKIGKRTYFLANNRFYVFNQANNKLEPISILNEAFCQIKNIKNVIAKSSTDLWIITDLSIYECSFDGYHAAIKKSYRINIDNNISLVTFSENISVINDSISIICNDDGVIIHKDVQQKAGNRIQFEEPIIQSFSISNYHTLASTILSQDNGNKTFKIPYKYNSINVDTQIPHAFAENLLTQHYLSGIDKNWSKAEKSNKISYSRLPPGNYKLHIRATNLLNQYSKEKILSFKILNPWYQTTIFYLSCVFLILSLLCIIFIVYKKRLKKRHTLEMKKLEKKLLENQNEQLQMKIEQNKAQMLTQTSLIMQKNDIILKIKNIIETISEKNTKQTLKPLFYQINALISQDINNEEDWNMFLLMFEEKHPTFFKELKKQCPELTDNDLRLCACLKLNMNTKDIAQLMNLSTRAVENSRYRVRKKLKLEPSDNLNEFFISFE